MILDVSNDDDNIIDTWDLDHFMTEYLELDTTKLDDPILEHDIQVIQ